MDNRPVHFAGREQVIFLYFALTRAELKCTNTGMIKVGDIVRYSNKYISAKGIAPGKRRCSNFKSRRGCQQLLKVVEICHDHWDWRSKRHNQIVRLSNGQVLSTYWVRFVRRYSLMTA
jgi:hypothetical protein